MGLIKGDKHAMHKLLLLGILVLLFSHVLCGQNTAYPIVDTDVFEFSNDIGLISEPGAGEPFYGQDASFQGNQPFYTDHENGTITDNVTGLTWEQSMGEKITYAEAYLKADSMTLGGHDNWRVPTIKELYSLILFTGRVSGATAIDLFIDTAYFDQPLGDPDLGEREIDAQTWSSTQYTGLTMRGDSTVFGVNFVDGRIKGYPQYQPGSNNTIPRSMYFRMVRGNPSYGINDFGENVDGTISDYASGLMWQQADDGQMRDWEEALAYAENLELAGYADWRLPNAKELQSILDYSRSPQASGSAAIDPIFTTTEIQDPNGNSGQYPYFWSGTTHRDGPEPYSSAVYFAFGEAQGKMNNTLMDVHGAGSQRSDPKSGDISDYPRYQGPQGDVRYVYNAVRCVRDITAELTSIHAIGEENQARVYPNPTAGLFTLQTKQYGEGTSMSLIDSAGRVILEKEIISKNSIQIDLANYPDGLYLLCLFSGQECKPIKIIRE